MFLEVVDRHHQLVQLQGFLQSLAFVVLEIEVCGAFQEQPACPLQDLLVELVGSLEMPSRRMSFRGSDGNA